nr:MAG TPA: hypothetical protein [Caudoviricetes sp.]
MSYLEELLPEFRKGAKIRRTGLSKPVNAKGYIFYKEGKIYNEFGRECEPDLGLWLSKNDWELYEEPIDWQYIIDHECLCWFWEDIKQDKLAQNLNSVDSNSPFMFVDSRNVAYKHCRPVRKDEVTFYEDKK